MNSIFLDVEGVLNSIDNLEKVYKETNKPHSGFNYPFDERCLEEIVSEFCDGYYGKCSKLAQDYLYLFEDNIKGDLWLYDDADSEMFTDEVCQKAKEIINKMEKLNNSDLVNKLDKSYAHTKKLILSYKYLELVRLPIGYPNRDNLVDEFFDNIMDAGITELFERTSLDFSKEVIKKTRYLLFVLKGGK